MIVKLTYTNNLSVPVVLRNNQGSAQPLKPLQPLEMTFSIEPDKDGVADIILICEPAPVG